MIIERIPVVKKSLSCSGWTIEIDRSEPPVMGYDLWRLTKRPKKKPRRTKDMQKNGK